MIFLKDYSNQDFDYGNNDVDCNNNDVDCSNQDVDYIKQSKIIYKMYINSSRHLC